MIERIYTEEQISGLPEHGTAAQKIRALWLAYGGNWDFCRFFRQEVGFMSALDGSFVICESPDMDFEETAEFLTVCGFSDIFCSKHCGEMLSRHMEADFHKVNLMTYIGPRASGNLPESVQPSEIWNIIEKRFSPAFEPWYLDMSHRVRHGVSRCYSDGKAALVVQHEINGEALISQVCVLPELEGRGYASALLRNVCKNLSTEVQIICDDELCGFYEKNDFIKSAEMYIITPR